MNPDTICLEIIRMKSRLRISLWNSQDTLIEPGEKEYPEADVAEKCRKIAQALNHKTGRDHLLPDALEEIRKTGTLLCDDLLTATVLDYIKKSNARHLILKMDDQLVHIPWELLYVGTSFLCRKFAMGRIVDTRQSFSKTPRTCTSPPGLLILANPERDLENADTEGKKIVRAIDIRNLEAGREIMEATLLSRSKVTKDTVKEKIRDFDFVHFSGHAEFDSQESGKKGWKLFDGCLTPHDISGMIGGEMPLFVFSNACQSACTYEWNDQSFSLVNSFLRAGVRHYLGTFWKIADEPGSRFAQEFYRHLLLGFTTGEAVRCARESLIKIYGPEYIGWAAYLLYGNPEICFFPPETGKNSIAVPDRDISDAHPPDAEKSLQPRGGAAEAADSRPHQNRSVSGFYPSYLKIAALIMLLVTAFALYHRNVGTVSVPEIMNSEMMKILVRQAEAKRQRIDFLYKELEKITGGPVRGSAGDEKTSAPLTLAMVFDAETLHNETQNLLVCAVQSQIKEVLPDVRLLHRKSLDKILEELIREKPEKFTLQFPEILVFLEISKGKSQTYVLMQAVRKDTSEITGVFTETLDNSALILEQKEKISSGLIEHLKTYRENFVHNQQSETL
ncbi:MAG: CHAT domain-containing protein [Desulfobacterales bacterium]